MTTMRAACVFHSGKQKSVLPSILTLGAISKIEARETPRKKHDIQFEYDVLSCGICQLSLILQDDPVES